MQTFMYVYGFGDQSHGLLHAKSVLNHWASPQPDSSSCYYSLSNTVQTPLFCTYIVLGIISNQ